MARGTAEGAGTKATPRGEAVAGNNRKAQTAANSGGHATRTVRNALRSHRKKGPAAARGDAPKAAGSVGKANGASARLSAPQPPVRNAGKKRKNRSAGGAAGGTGGAEVLSHSGKDAEPEQHAALLQEIISLGGSAEDFELLKGVDSDVEAAPSKAAAGRNSSKKLPTNEAALNEDLKAFLKSINYDPKVAAEAAAADEGSEGSFVEPEHEEMEQEDAKSKKSLAGKDGPAPVTGARLKTKMRIQRTPRWYDIELPLIPASETKVSKAAAESRLAEGMKFLEEENAAREAKPGLSSGDQSFLAMLFKSGTLHDRISAMTLAVQESPVHAVKSLDSLMGFLKKNGRREAVMTIASLKDLLASGLLPDRKLKYFRDQPSTQPKVTETHLMLWAFEDYLKKLYFEFIQSIERLSHDTLLHVKQTMLQAVYDLLVAKPEQEQNLLRLLMNKLGDMERKIASKASFLLQQLLVAHPNMKGVVIEECEQTLLRKNVGVRLQYYAVIALNQTILTHGDQDVAAKLVDLYITIFKQLLHEGGDENDTKPAEGKRQKAMKKKRKGKGSTSASSNSTIIEGERSKLVTALLTGVNRAFPFAKMDENVYDGHMDTLFKITHTGTFNLSIQALTLIYQAMSANQTVSDRFYRALYASLLDPRLMSSSKQPMYLNLLFKALKTDIVPSRVKAFVKRIIQVAGMHQPPFICGSFYMISEIIEAYPSIRAMINQPEDNEDQQEHFVDVDREEMQGAEGDTLGNAKEATECPAPTSSSDPAGTKNEYDPLKREPIYANADRTCLWELVPFSKHYHPAVALFARTLLAGERIARAPEMEAHTLIHFLEKFVYRNAKAREPQRGFSIMQPSRPAPSASGKWAVNTEEWFSQSVDQIPVEELFFHKYFTTKREQDPNFAKKAKTKKKDSEGDGEAEDDGDLDEDEVWDAMMKSGGLPAGGPDEDASDVESENLGPMSSDEEESALAEGEGEREEDEGNSDEDEDGEGEDDESDSGEHQEGDFDEFGMEDEADLVPEEEVRISGREEAEEDEEERRRPKKKRRVALPTFASAEDYAHLLDQD